MTSIKKTKQIY